MSLHLDSQLSQLLYTKVPVIRGLRSIRLLRVHAGSWSEPISGDLHGVFLESAPGYKALSYAWVNGSSALSEVMDDFILCNGIKIRITPNLYAALRRLRERRQPVEVWVDSVCINQKDPSERSTQVALMRDIYNRSTKVVIWLGECGEYDDLGYELMRTRTRLGLPEGGALREEENAVSRIDWFGDEQDREKWELFVLRQQSRQHSFDVHIRDIFGAFCMLWLLSVGVRASEIVHLRHISQSASIINGLHAIMEQSWWRRTWVIQETVVANKATVYYSGISAPWAMFAEAAVAYDFGSLATSVESVYPYLQPLAQFSRTIVEIEGTRRTWTNPSRLTTLLPLLRMFRSRQASDARDKVFALLGLVQFWEPTAESGLKAKIDADYNMSADSVFWQTTTTLIKQMRSLDVLMGTLGLRTSTSASGGGYSTGKPSWVTDWSCPPEVHENVRVSNLRLYDAANGAIPGVVRAHGRSVLEIHGCPFDEVELVAPELPVAEEGTAGGGGRWRAVVSEWERCLEQLLARTATYVAGGEVASAFWRTLCGDIEHVRDAETGRAVFRRVVSASRSSTYAKWRGGDPGRKRRTAIIAGYWQENGGDADGDVEDRNAFHHAVECASGRRRFFLTRTGFIGCGPRDIAPGDTVCIVFGSRAPFILRRTQHVSVCRREVLDKLIEPLVQRTFIQAGAQAKSKQRGAQANLCSEVHRNCFSAVGDAYIHGIMDGEALQYFLSEKEKTRMTGPIFLV